MHDCSVGVQLIVITLPSVVCLSVCNRSSVVNNKSKVFPKSRGPLGQC